MDKIGQWLKQPSSVVGISALLGAVSALLAGQMDWMQAIPVIAGAVTAIALPDNSAAKGDAQALATAVMRQLSNLNGEK